MQSELLPAIVELTAQRDIDSLEASLLRTVARLFSAVTVSLYKLEQKGNQNLALETMRVSANGKANYQVAREGSLIIPGGGLKECLTRNSQVEQPAGEDRKEIHFPVRDGRNVVSIISVLCGAGREPPPQLQELLAIYKNYWTTLHDGTHDDLTGLLNRKTFEKEFSKLTSIQRELHQKHLESGRESEKRHSFKDDRIFLAIADIDLFKQINDTYGHVYGDEILLLVVDIMRQVFRGSDMLFRFGGEEFVILLEPTSRENAYVVLERFRAHVESYSFPQVGKVTVSMGYTCIGESDHPSNVIGRADHALYYAKENGRNGTFFYDYLIENKLIKQTASTGTVELF